MKLFAIYIGGDHPAANIELHDMRFVAAPSIAETHDELRLQWWGTPDSLHIDCWAQIDHVDGYQVALRPEPYAGQERLYYVNLGGYDPAQFTEQHRNIFVVARSLGDAKKRALAFASDWDMPHRDDLYEAEQAYALDEQIGAQRLHIHLEFGGAPVPLNFNCHYEPIGVSHRV